MVLNPLLHEDEIEDVVHGGCGHDDLFLLDGFRRLLCLLRFIIILILHFEAEEVNPAEQKEYECDYKWNSNS